MCPAAGTLPHIKVWRAHEAYLNLCRLIGGGTFKVMKVKKSCLWNKAFLLLGFAVKAISRSALYPPNNKGSATEESGSAAALELLDNVIEMVIWQQLRQEYQGLVSFSIEQGRSSPA